MGVLTSLLLLGRIIGTVADAAAVATTVEAAAVSSMSPFGLDRLGVLPLGRQLLPMLGKPSRHDLLVTTLCSNSIANVPPLSFLVVRHSQARPKKNAGMDAAGTKTRVRECKRKFLHQWATLHYCLISC